MITQPCNRFESHGKALFYYLFIIIIVKSVLEIFKKLISPFVFEQYNFLFVGCSY
ncbi:hypothetical protein QF028_001458 [Neobacillus sp. B4I6]